MPLALKLISSFLPAFLVSVITIYNPSFAQEIPIVATLDFNDQETGKDSICFCSSGEYFVHIRQATDAKARITTASVAQQKVVSSIILDSSEYRFAVSNELLFIADLKKQEIQSRPIANLEVVDTSVQFREQVEDIVVVANSLLFSRNGRLRLDCKTLQPSEIWAPYSEKQMTFQQFHDGWLIDGVLWNKSLTKPLLITDFAHRTDNKPLRDLWVEKAENRKPSLDYPICAAVNANQQIEIQALNGKVLGVIQSPPNFETMIFQGRRFIVGTKEKVVVFDLSGLELDKVTPPYEILREQSSICVRYGIDTQLTHKTTSGQSLLNIQTEVNEQKLPESESATVNYRKWVQSRKKSDYEHVTGRMPQDLNSRAPLLLKRLGIDEGRVFPERIIVSAEATGERATLAYYVLSCIPKELSAEIDDQVAKNKARQQKAAEKSAILLKAQQEEEAKDRVKKREEENLRQEREAMFGSLGTTLIPVLIVVIPMLALLPFWGITRGASGKVKFNTAIVLALLASVPLLICFWNYIPVLKYTFQMRLPISAPVLWSTLVFAYLAYTCSAMIILRSKGYTLTIVALVVPLSLAGLVVALLLPNRKAEVLQVTELVRTQFRKLK